MSTDDVRIAFDLSNDHPFRNIHALFWPSPKGRAATGCDADSSDDSGY